MNNKRLRGVLSHRLFIILLLLLQIAFFGYLVLSGSESSWLVSLFFSLVSMNTRSSGSKHEKPGYKLTWVFTILTLPIFGGAFYLMMQLQPSVRRFRKQVESSQEALTRRLPRHEGALAGAEAQGPCAVRLARYLENGVGFPVYPASRVEYFPSGEAVFRSTPARIAQGQALYIHRVLYPAGRRDVGRGSQDPRTEGARGRGSARALR